MNVPNLLVANPAMCAYIEHVQASDSAMSASNCGESVLLSIPARVGRKDATLVEIDRCGVRVQHSGALPLGVELRLTFVSAGEVFAAATQVLACRVVALGAGEGGSTLFESKLNFTEERAAEAVERLFGISAAARQTA